MKLKTSLAVGIFAFWGGILRYVIGLGFHQVATFPYGTLCVNLIGAFGLSFLLRYCVVRNRINATYTLAIGTGFLGAFTTFSSFSVDTLRLLQTNQWLAASLYVGISLIGGVGLSLIADYWAVWWLDRSGKSQGHK
ncbi:fluoride efflux transporter CrcB [Latilactobacillus graminis]|uniref:Fluoride-specific ion channel FluC n=2 Tax=Latilactobacillus graminis TaxID=60519 RepID=A0AA89I116_9LACO|nr:fluoride efflux transporter CrcB [Latilactobacillus graminis]KRM23381.1 crcB-like family protein [Latilactobacillus graminis DSM 20719]QFP80268.1 fluoride efflux transporter CrcB [Latilactobacillus graminis]